MPSSPAEQAARRISSASWSEWSLKRSRPCQRIERRAAPPCGRAGGRGAGPSRSDAAGRRRRNGASRRAPSESAACRSGKLDVPSGLSATSSPSSSAVSTPRRADERRDGGHARRPVMQVARDEAGAAALDISEQTVAVELDLADPFRARPAPPRPGARAAAPGPRAGARASRPARAARLDAAFAPGRRSFGTASSSARGIRAGALEFVVPLDQEPGIAALLAARLEADEGEAAVEALAVQHEFQLAVAHAGFRVLERLPGAAVPGLDRAGAVIARPGCGPGRWRSRADDPRHGRRGGGPRGRATGPSAPPSSTARRHARGGNPSAARRDARHASARRRSGPPRRLSPAPAGARRWR